MPFKKDIFGNRTRKWMSGDYQPINRRIKLDRYAMPTHEEIFDMIGHAEVFNTLDLRSRYHQLLMKKGDKHKIVFWGIDEFGKDKLYQCKFLTFGLKNAPIDF